MPCYALDGMRPVVHPTAYVHPSAVLIGDVDIGPGCYVGPCASLRGDFGRIVVMAGANIQDGCVMHGFPRGETVVEADGHIGHGAILHGCRVRRGALVGMNAVVMDEAEVGEDAFVGAQSLVPARARLSAAHLHLGSPAREVRPLTDAELAWKVRGTQAYQDLAQRCLTGLVEVPALTEPPPPHTAPDERPAAMPDHAPLKTLKDLS